MSSTAKIYLTDSDSMYEYSKGQKVYIKEIANYWDYYGDTAAVDAFIRIGTGGAFAPAGGAKLFIQTTGGVSEIPYGTTLRIRNNNSRSQQESGERLYYSDNPLYAIENYVYIVPGSVGISNEIFLNMSDSRGFAYTPGSFTINLTALQPPNNNPIANGEQLNVAERATNETYYASFSTLLANDSDKDGDSLSIDMVSGISGGTVRISDNKIWLSTTDSSVTSAKFSYRVTDGHGGTAWATASLSIPEAKIDPDLKRLDELTAQYKEVVEDFIGNLAAGFEAAYESKRGVVAPWAGFRLTFGVPNIRPLGKVLGSIKDKLGYLDSFIKGIEAINSIAENGLKEGGADAFKTLSAALLAGQVGRIAGVTVATAMATSTAAPALAALAIGVGTAMIVSWAVEEGSEAFWESKLGGKLGTAAEWAYDSTASTLSWVAAGLKDAAIEVANNAYSWFKDVFFPSPESSDASLVNPAFLTLGDGGTTQAIPDYVQTLVGGAGTDIVTLGNVGNTVILRGIDTLTGGSANDFVITGDTGTTFLISGVETLVGGAGTDIVTLGNAGNTIILRGLEMLTGGTGNDFVLTGDTGTTFLISGVETLVGGAGTDIVTLGNAGNTIILRGLEMLTGGTGNDFVLTGDTGTTFLISGVETLVGGAGTDIVTLGNAGNTIILRGLEMLTGGTGNDFVLTGDTGTTFLISGVETLVGGAGTDIVTLGNAGNTIILRGLETLTGGAGADVVTLGNTVNTMTVGGVETLIGGTDADTVTVSSGSIRFQGSTGADILILQSGGGADRVVFDTSSDGAAPGTSTGYDQIANFQAGTDGLVLTGALRTAVDRNANGLVGGGSRTTNQINLATDEVAVLSTAVSSLSDTSLSAVRTMIGTLQNTSAGTSLTVLANNGTNTGVYAVTDANGDGVVAATEISFLGVFTGTASIALGNITYG